MGIPVQSVRERAARINRMFAVEETTDVDVFINNTWRGKFKIFLIGEAIKTSSVSSWKWLMRRNGKLFFPFFFKKNGLFVIWVWKKKKISQKREAEKHGDGSASDSWHANLCQTLPPGPSLSHQNSKQGIRTHFPRHVDHLRRASRRSERHPDRRERAPLRRGAGDAAGNRARTPRGGSRQLRS